MNLGEVATKREPNYFVVLKAVPIPTRKAGLPTGLLGEELYLVLFGPGELEHPNSEPIGVFGDGKGDRQYLWRDAYWGEYPLDTGPSALAWEAGKLDVALREALTAMVESRRVNAGAGAVPQGAVWRALYRLSS